MRKGHVRWLCRCDCGRQTRADHSNLTRGQTKSCGRPLCRSTVVLPPDFKTRCQKRLTEDEVRQIWEAHYAHGTKTTALAKKYGVSRKAIRDILLQNTNVRITERLVAEKPRLRRPDQEVEIAEEDEDDEHELRLELARRRNDASGRKFLASELARRGDRRFLHFSTPDIEALLAGINRPANTFDKMRARYEGTAVHTA